MVVGLVGLVCPRLDERSLANTRLPGRVSQVRAAWCQLLGVGDFRVTLTKAYMLVTSLVDMGALVAAYKTMYGYTVFVPFC